MPKSAKSFRRHLTLGDVAIASHGLLVTLQFTKTIQFGGRHLPFFFCLPLYPAGFSLFTHDSFSPPHAVLVPVFSFQVTRTSFRVQNIVLCLLSVHIWSQSGFPIHRVSGELPSRALGAAYRGKLLAVFR